MSAPAVMSVPMVNLVVQISGKRDNYIERVELAEQGLSIGRAWNSDIIVQDKYVDADQLILKLDDQGTPSLEDVSSTNGSLLDNKLLNDGEQAYRWGDEIRIGDTTLRIYDASAGVAKTANRSSWYSLLEPFQSWRALVFIGAVAALLCTLYIWAFSTEPFKFLDFLVRFVSVAISLFVWTLLFGSISKLVRGQANMRAHWVLACLITIAFIVLSFVVNVVRFNIQSPDVGQLIANFVFGGLFVAFIFAVLTYSSHLSSRAKWFWSLLLVSGVVANVYSDSFLKQDHERWNERAEAEKATLPPALMFRKPITMDQYFDETEYLFDRVKNP